MSDFEIKLPRRTLDISALADEAAQPNDALLLLSASTRTALTDLPNAALLEVRDMMFELGLAMQNTAFPTIRVDLDLELEPPQDWVAEVSLQGNVVRSFTHSKAERAFALAVREAVIQATSMGIRSRSEMIADWAIDLGAVCEQLDVVSVGLAIEESDRNVANNATAAVGDVELNPEGDNGETS